MAARDHIWFHSMEVIMIDFKSISVGDKVDILFTDGDSLQGIIVSLDDDEESGLGEDGISIKTPDGQFIGIGESEVKDIILEQ